MRKKSMSAAVLNERICF